MSFPRYPTYKPSGVEWLGEVPEHWEVKPAKRLIGSIEQGWSPQCENYSVDGSEGWGVLKVGCVNGGVFRHTENKWLPVELDPRPELAVLKGDLLVSRANTRELVGSAAVAIQDYPNLLLCDKLYRMKVDSKEARPQFLSYFLGSREARGKIELEASGASDSMLNISQSVILELPCPAPPAYEQAAIATFLDHETGKIDALIAEQQRLIELLQEKRQAVISHAVTKGLNPDAPMKDSGVEWLGEVPEHWEVGALSYALGAVGDVDHYMPETVQEGVPYVMTGDLKDLASQIDFEGCKQVADQDYKRLSRKIKTAMGDLIMARYATIGTVAYVDVDREFLVSYSCVTIKPDAAKADGMYLFFCLKSDSFFKGIQQRVNTNTQENIGIGDLKKVKVALPPVNEQLEIVKHLQAQVSEMDGLIKGSKVTVGLLKERRSALISAAVTGQIDVRALVPEAEAA